MTTGTLDLLLSPNLAPLSTTTFNSLVEGVTVGDDLPNLVTDDDTEPDFLRRARSLATAHPTATALARLAKSELDAGLRVSAVKTARRVMELADSHDTAPLIIAAEVLAACGAATDAAGVLNRLNGTDGQRHTAVLAATLAARRGDLEAAGRLTADAKGPEGLALKGLFHIERGEYQAGLAALRASANLEPRSFAVHCNLAYTYLALGSPKKSLRAAMVAYELAPTSRVAGANLAAALHANGRVHEAVEKVDRLLQIFPSDLQLYLAKAELLVDASRTMTALKLLRSLKSRSWYPNLSVKETCEVEAAIASLEHFTSDVPRADAFQRVLNALIRCNYSSPQIARTLPLLASSVSEREDLEDALLHVEQGPAKDARFHLQIVLALIDGDIIRANGVSDEWRSHDPTELGVWIVGSYVGLLQADLDRAEMFSKEGRKRYPQDRTLANNLAYTYALRGHPAAARQVLLSDDRFPDVIAATEAAIKIAEGDVEGGRRAYDALARRVRAVDPLRSTLILLYRNLTMRLLTGQELPLPAETETQHDSYQVRFMMKH